MAIANEYDVGDLVRVKGTFKVSDTLTNPTAVTLKVKKPDGTVSTVATTNASTGVYHADVSIDQAGTWRYRFAGTGDAQAAGESVFVVRRQEVV